MRDVIAPGLRVLFCGINPGLYTAAVGHHFARPGNRFWPALFAAGITPRLFSPFEERELLPLGYGITNVVQRATVGENDLSPVELAAGGRRLVRTVNRCRPRCLAVLGQQLDVPPEVLASLPSLDQIRTRATEAQARATQALQGGPV